MRRRLKWLRLRALRALWSHYLLGVTIAIVVAAAAAGLGVFDAEDGRLAARAPAVQPATPLPPDPTGVPSGPPYLTVTYVLVSSEAEREVWNNVETTINQRELLSKMALEVLVITSAEQAAAAYEMIDSIRARYPWNEYVIEDLRTD